MKIYVACLSAYNSGTLHGEWIDVTDPETMNEQIAAMLAKSPEPNAEEYAVHDYEDVPGNWGEHPDLEELCEFCQLVEEHGEAYAVYADHFGKDYATAKDFEDRYNGEYRNAEEFGEQLLEDCGDLNEIPERLRFYFDYEKWTRDLELSGDYAFVDSPKGVYVFRAC